MFECIFCGRATRGAYQCKSCFAMNYDLSEPWVARLLEMERRWRNSNNREDKNSAVFSDFATNYNGVVVDGWDRIEQIPEQLSSNSSSARITLRYEIDTWIEDADLTKGEKNAVLIQKIFGNEGKLHSEEGAKLLSEWENKTINAAAYRRRLSDARAKMLELEYRPQGFLFKQKASKKAA
jgi:hypothetical protein